MAFVQELKANFKKLADNDRLSHAYLFFGRDLNRQYEFAKSLANFLETGEWDEDRFLLDAQFKEGDLGIDEARGAVNFLWQKPVKSKRRTLIVKDARLLTLYAQNAILKVSEEPPEHGLLILCLRDPNALIYPLSSRFQKVYFSGEAKIVFAPEIEQTVRQILKAPTAKQKSELIKQMLESEIDLEQFIAALLNNLKNDLTGNWRIIKEVLRRWTLMNQFNVNKKLQLETIFFEYPSAKFMKV